MLSAEQLEHAECLYYLLSNREAFRKETRFRSKQIKQVTFALFYMVWKDNPHVAVELLRSTVGYCPLTEWQVAALKQLDGGSGGY